MTVAMIKAVHVGRIAPLGPDGTASAFAKQPVDGRITAGPLGLAGDEQADLRVHGGPDKAIYAYPVEGYTAWIADFPDHASTLIPGCMGENLVVCGLSEDTVRIGDIHRIGTALMQITQPRQPCFKLGLHHDAPGMVARMSKTGRCGWYLRVLEPGEIGPGDRIDLVAQAAKGWSIRRFAAAVRVKAIRPEILSEIAAMPGLAENWQRRALRMLREEPDRPGQPANSAKA